MRLKPIVVIGVLLLVVASLLVSGCTQNQQTVSANPTGSTPTNSQNSPTVSVTATSLGSSSSLTSSYGTPTASATGNKFVSYAMYFQNINGKNLDMGNPTEVTLRDTQGNIYSYDSFGYSVKQQVSGRTLEGITSQSNTQPGDKYSGIIVFQIPQNATPKSLTYDDYSNRITINL
jgi:uncharacterized protein YcfL